MTSQPTESRNPDTVEIDLLPAGAALDLIIREDAHAVAAVRDALPALSALTDAARDLLARGGSLHYFGAGASGRLALLDVTELNPTYGFPRERAVAHFPGGSAAFVDSSIDREDAAADGEQDAAALRPGDVAVGVTTSGSTPYVVGALRAARTAGALTALVTCDPASLLGGEVDHLVVLRTGPEAIMGSTRMKAGTATKVALNAFSTALMVGLGRTYSNLMIDMTVTNEKLAQRALHILAEATGASAEDCREALSRADGRVPVALVMLATGLPAAPAAAALAEHGSARLAVTSR